MANLQTYKVVREHEGDRRYAVGDTREALPSDVAHLVPHVLAPVEAQEAPATPAKPPRKAKAPKITE